MLGWIIGRVINVEEDGQEVGCKGLEMAEMGVRVEAELGGVPLGQHQCLVDQQLERVEDWWSQTGLGVDHLGQEFGKRPIESLCSM